jgi:hypothetical protein
MIGELDMSRLGRLMFQVELVAIVRTPPKAAILEEYPTAWRTLKGTYEYAQVARPQHPSQTRRIISRLGGLLTDPVTNVVQKPSWVHDTAIS